MADHVNPSQESATSDGEDPGPVARVGSVIRGKWTVDALLGVGGMAAVYAATHRNMQRAALKILHIDFARERTICERFLREAYVSNKVGHPACVQVLDDDVTEQDEPFLIMELLLGETVRDAWKKSGRAMSVTQVLQIAEAVLDCLAACHAIGVIHRDLKPANIFITEEGVIKVLDFGVAQMRSATNERTATGTALGTPAYMSPEQAMGLVDQLDGRADLFSVGAMIHALITGHRINNGRTEQEALIMAATKPVPSVARLAPNLPLEVIQIIDKSLQWDRRNRYGDAREMQAFVVDALGKLGSAPLVNRGGRQVGNVAVAAPSPSQHALSPSAHDLPPHASPAQNALEARRSIPDTAQAPPRASSSHLPPYAAPRASSPNLPPYVPSSKVPQAIVAEPAAAENDPRVATTRDLLKHVDRTLPSALQYGWSHPATERTLRTSFEAISDVLSRDANAMSLTIRPYSFLSLGQTVWEPAGQLDAIPYNLFACGMRSLRIEQGITLDEMRDFLTLLLLNPSRDLPPEDDIAAAFWEKGLKHIHYESVDAFAEGDANEREAFFTESDEIEQLAGDAARSHASRIEAKAMAVATDKSALKGRVPSVLALDGVVRAVFAQQLDLPSDKWQERYVDALVEGYLDAAMNRDAPLVLSSLRKSAADLVVAGRIDVVVHLQQLVAERLATRLNGPDFAKLSGAFTNALFGADVLELTLKSLQQNPERVAVFVPILATMSPNELGTMLTALRNPTPAPLRAAILGFVERVLPGRENEVAAAVAGLEPESAWALLSVLGSANTPSSRQALMALTQSEDMTVRIEAKVLLAPTPEQAHQELSAMLESPSALVRMAALRAIGRHRIMNAWPAILRQAKQPNFNDFGIDERRELLLALAVVSPERGEPVLLELAKKGGMLVSEEREATRAVAIEVLGRVSRSSSVAQALRDVGAARWGTSEETRAAALAAVLLIAARGEAGGPPQ